MTRLSDQGSSLRRVIGTNFRRNVTRCKTFRKALTEEAKAFQAFQAFQAEAEGRAIAPKSGTWFQANAEFRELPEPFVLKWVTNRAVAQPG